MAKKNTIQESKTADNIANFFGSKTERLQTIIEILDANDRPIDELLVYYEEGMKIAKECKTYLNSVEGKIIDITKEYEAEDE